MPDKRAFTTRFDATTYSRLRAHCAQTGISLQAFVHDAVLGKLDADFTVERKACTTCGQYIGVNDYHCLYCNGHHLDGYLCEKMVTDSHNQEGQYPPCKAIICATCMHEEDCGLTEGPGCTCDTWKEKV
jgi:hypothetical protein